MNEACHLLCNGWSATTSLFISATWPGSRGGERLASVDQKFVEKDPSLRFSPRSISPRSRQIYNDANRGRRAPIECLDRIFTRGTGLVSSVCAVYMYTYDAWKRVNWSGREGGREKKVFSRDREESMGPDRRGRGRRRGEASVALLLDGDR